jgi:hypothetical protein
MLIEMGGKELGFAFCFFVSLDTTTTTILPGLGTTDHTHTSTKHIHNFK